MAAPMYPWIKLTTVVSGCPEDGGAWPPPLSTIITVLLNLAAAAWLNAGTMTLSLLLM